MLADQTPTWWLNHHVLRVTSPFPKLYAEILFHVDGSIPNIYNCSMVNAPKSFCIYLHDGSRIQVRIQVPIQLVFTPISKFILLIYLDNLFIPNYRWVKSYKKHHVTQPSTLSIGLFLVSVEPRYPWLHLLGARTPHPSLISPWPGEESREKQGDFAKPNLKLWGPRIRWNIAGTPRTDWKMPSYQTITIAKITFPFSLCGGVRRNVR